MTHASFQMRVEATGDDIDPLGHVNNISYVRWIQDVAVAHSSAVGLDFEAYGRMGGIFVIRRHEIDYLRPVLRGEAVEVCTWVGSVMAAKCIRHTELRRVGNEGDLVARAETVWGFVDVTTGRPTRIPSHVKAAFGRA
jgi:acyl-CoA thioester hydrolase